MTVKQKITPCLWFEGNAEEAADVLHLGVPQLHDRERPRRRSDTPGVQAGQRAARRVHTRRPKYLALNGGPHDKFNDAISMSVDCEDQAEVDGFGQR